jgi:hypothetical protein
MVIITPAGPEPGVTATVTVTVTHGPYGGQAVISGAADAGDGSDAAVIVSAEQARTPAARHFPSRDATAILLRRELHASRTRSDKRPPIACLAASVHVQCLPGVTVKKPDFTLLSPVELPPVLLDQI